MEKIDSGLQTMVVLTVFCNACRNVSESTYVSQMWTRFVDVCVCARVRACVGGEGGSAGGALTLRVEVPVGTKVKPHYHISLFNTFLPARSSQRYRCK